MDRVCAVLLVAFAALSALFEGPAQIACVLAIVATAAAGWFRGYRPGAVEIGLLVWILAGIPGTFDGDDGGSTEGALRPLIALAFLVGAVGVSRASDDVLAKMAWGFCIACVINGVYGYVQVFLTDPPLEAFLVGKNRSEHLVDPDHAGRLRMATGLFYNRLKLAHVGVIGLGLLGLIAVEHKHRRVVAIVGAVLLAGALFLTYRRAAPIALGVAGVAFAIALGRVRVAATSALTAAAIVVVFALTSYGRSRIGSADDDLAERWSIYQAAWRVFTDHALIGIGHGDYKTVIQRYAPSMPAALTTSPHNQALHVLVETGVVGLLGMSTAVLVSLQRILRRVRGMTSTTSVSATTDHFALLSLFVFVTLGLVHTVLYHAPVGLVFWCLLGVAAHGRTPQQSAAT